MADLKKLSGRPTMKAGKRTKKIDVRFTEEEFELIRSMEITLGISKTDIIRTKVLNDGKQVVVNAKSLLKVLDGIGEEMGRAGNNINQLARHANTLHLRGQPDPAVTGHFNTLMTNYIKIQQDLEVALRKIIRSMFRSNS